MTDRGQELSTRATHGVLWTSGSIGLQLVVTWFFFKVLGVEAMGAFQAALILVTLCQLLADMGMGAALVHFRAADERHFSSAFWTNLAVGICITALLVWAAGPIAHFATAPGKFGRDELARLLVLLAPMVLFASVSGLMRGHLQRALRFKAFSLAELISSLGGALGALLALLAGFGLWSVVASALARELALLASLWWAARWRPQFFFAFAALKRLLGFGLNTTGANAVNHLNSNLAYLFILLGLGDLAALGGFTFAYRFTMVPLGRAALTIARVGFPAMASIQDDDRLLQRGYLKAVQMVALLAWPALAGTAVFAADIAQLTHRDLHQALPAFRLLCLAGMVKAVGTVVGTLYLAKGKAHWSFRWTLVNLAVLFPGVYWGMQYGTTGVAAALALAPLLFLPVSQYLVNRLIGMNFATYFGALVRPFLITAAVLAALLLTEHLLAAVSPLLSLGGGIAVGLAVYLLALRLLAWEACLQLWGALKGRRPGS